MAASARGDLRPNEQETLREHLADCPECAPRAEDPAALECVLGALSRGAGPGPDFESRLVSGFRQGIGLSPDGRPSLSRRVGRQLVRLSVAVVIGVLLFVRCLNLQFFTDAFTGGVELSTFWNGFLRSPSYEGFLGRGNILADPQVFLATVHKLTSLYVETFLVTLMLLALGLVVIDAYRRRHVLLYG